MSEEMAVSDNTTGEETNMNSEETASAMIAEPEEAAPELLEEPEVPAPEESPPSADSPPPEVDPEEQGEPAVPLAVKQELHSDELDLPAEPIKLETDPDIKTEEDDIPNEIEACDENGEEKEDQKGIKRRASSAFSDVADEEFKGFFDVKDEIKTEDYNRVLERLEAEVTAATKAFIPLRTVMAMPPAPTRASKRARKDTDGSRPSSALSTKSDGDGSTDASSAAYSPAGPGGRGGRRTTTEMSSPLLRVPLERGWKRELVYRAALDAHSRRNADIYYYTPHGKKLRSTREVGENLAGTGLTLENFSFFKEPLGVDDPEKEIIR